MRIFQTVKKIIAGGGGAVNAKADQRAGFSVGIVLQLIAAEIRAGVSAAMAPLVLATRQAVGALVTTSVSGSTSADQRAGVTAENRCSGTPNKVDVRGGADVVQTTISLTRRVGGNAVTETAVGGRTDWATDANAISGTNGLHDAAVATFAGNALGARGGQLELDYPNHVNKSALTLTSVKLFFYGRVFSTVVNNADVQLRWEKGAGFTTLATITGDDDFRTTPKQFDITGSIASWSDLDALRSAMRTNAALGETWQAEFDACELEIIASKTEP